MDSVSEEIFHTRCLPLRANTFNISSINSKRGYKKEGMWKDGKDDRDDIHDIPNRRPINVKIQ